MIARRILLFSVVSAVFFSVFLIVLNIHAEDDTPFYQYTFQNDINSSALMLASLDSDLLSADNPPAKVGMLLCALEPHDTTSGLTDVQSMPWLFPLILDDPPFITDTSPE